MTGIVTAVGIVLILLTLRDIFHTLWHPAGFGMLAHGVFAVIWWLGHRSLAPRRLAVLSGPIGLLAVAGLWSALLATGFALVYLPHLPGSFNLGSSLSPEDSSNPVRAAYLSLVALTTLGFGDVLPEAGWLRIVVPLQALVGFVLLTAAISWILQIYPALSRRRALARRLDLLRRTEADATVRAGGAAPAVTVLESLTEALVGSHIDLLQYAESYYFRESDPQLSLAHQLEVASDLAEAGQASAHEDVRAAATRLEYAVEDLTDTLARRHLITGATPRETIARFRADQDL